MSASIWTPGTSGNSDISSVEHDWIYITDRGGVVGQKIGSVVTDVIAECLETGKGLAFPPGLFLWDKFQPFDRFSDFRIRGAGMGKTIIQKTWGYPDGQTVFGFTGGYRNRIEHLTLDCWGLLGRGIHLQDINSVVENVEVLNCCNRPFGMNGGSNTFDGITQPDIDPVYNILGITQANPCVVSIQGPHILQVGYQVQFDNVGGMVEISGESGIAGTITSIAGNALTMDFDSTTFTAFTGGGTLARLSFFPSGCKILSCYATNAGETGFSQKRMHNSVMFNNTAKRIMSEGMTCDATYHSRMTHNTLLDVARSNCLKGLNIDSGGTGYAYPPKINIISSTTGTGAAAECTVLNGSINQVRMLNFGDRYSPSTTTITLSDTGGGSGAVLSYNGAGGGVGAVGIDGATGSVFAYNVIIGVQGNIPGRGDRQKPCINFVNHIDNTSGCSVLFNHFEDAYLGVYIKSVNSEDGTTFGNNFKNKISGNHFKAVVLDFKIDNGSINNKLWNNTHHLDQITILNTAVENDIDQQDLMAIGMVQDQNIGIHTYSAKEKLHLSIDTNASEPFPDTAFADDTGKGMLIDNSGSAGNVARLAFFGGSSPAAGGKLSWFNKDGLQTFIRGSSDGFTVGSGFKAYETITYDIGKSGNRFRNFVGQSLDLLLPGSSAALTDNNSFTIYRTSNTQLVLALKGGDGVVRTATIVLA